MREEFPGWYAKAPATLKAMWERALFVPDANILLHCLRHRADVRDQLLRILEVLREDLWIPYQVGLEFQRNRLEVEYGALDAYDRLTKDYEAILGQAKEKLRQLRAHPVISAEEEISELDDFLKAFTDRMAAGRKKHPSENLRQATERLAKLFAGRVGPAWAPERLVALRKEGEERYARKVPPGYKDARKDEDPNAKFGDLVIWKDMIEKAKADKRPVIFITDDAKEDWWRIHRGRKLGVRPELVEEFSAQAGQDFHMYELGQFLRLAAERHPEIPAANVDKIEKSLNDDEQARRMQESSAETDAQRRRILALEMERDRLITLLAGVPTLDDSVADEPRDRASLRARLAAVDEDLASVRARAASGAPAS